jgi:hypothetical protein
MPLVDLIGTVTAAILLVALVTAQAGEETQPGRGMSVDEIEKMTDSIPEQRAATTEEEKNLLSEWE